MRHFYVYTHMPYTYAVPVCVYVCFPFSLPVVQSSWILVVKNLGGTQLGDSSVPHGVDQGHPFGSWAGVEGPRWRSTRQASWQ